MRATPRVHRRMRLLIGVLSAVALLALQIQIVGADEGEEQTQEVTQQEEQQQEEQQEQQEQQEQAEETSSSEAASGRDERALISSSDLQVQQAEVCPSLDGKYEVDAGWEGGIQPGGITIVSADDEAITFTIADGWVLTGICVKTGSELNNAIDIPSVPLAGPQTVTITKAGPGLGLSHISFATEQSEVRIDEPQLSVTKTVEGVWEREIEYEWDIVKTVSPGQLQLGQGESGVLQYTLTVTKSVKSQVDTLFVSGEICVENIGTANATNIIVKDQIQVFVDGSWVNALPEFEIGSLTELEPDASQCFIYADEEFEGDPTKDYRNLAIVTSAGLDPVQQSEEFSFPEEPDDLLEIDAEALVLDFLPESGCPDGFNCGIQNIGGGGEVFLFIGLGWELSDSAVLTYELELENDDAECADAVTLVNTAYVLFDSLLESLPDEPTLEDIFALLAVAPQDSAEADVFSADCGTVTVTKVTVPAGSTQVFDFDGSLGEFDLAHGQSFGPVVVEPGALSIEELELDGWTLTGIVCEETTSELDLRAAQATIDLGAGLVGLEVGEGEHWTCTFTNIQDEVLGDPPIENGGGEDDIVLGATTDRREEALALTGASLITMLLFALALAAGGTLTRHMGRRRGRHAA